MSILRENEITRLNSIADLVDDEAKTWVDGWAVFQDGKYTFAKADEWAHVRYVKLKSGAEYLRTLSKVLTKRAAQADDKKEV